MVAAAENMAGHEDQALDFVRQVHPKVYLNCLIVRLADDLLEAGERLLRSMLGMKTRVAQHQRSSA